MNKAIIMLILLIPIAMAIPTFHHFYGNVYDVNGTIINETVSIVAYINNESHGSINSVNGAYGYSELLFVEDGNDGDIITFYINGYVGRNYTFTNEAVTELNLTLNELNPQILCGNNIIDLGEECDSSNIPTTCQSLGYSSGSLSCKSDCMLDTSACTTAGAGAGGGGGGGGGGGASGEKVCTEAWICTSWQPITCPESRRQTRECNDVNNCGTTINKPSESRLCYYYQPEEEIAQTKGPVITTKIKEAAKELPAPPKEPLLKKAVDFFKKNKSIAAAFLKNNKWIALIIASMLLLLILSVPAFKLVGRLKTKKKIITPVDKLRDYIGRYLQLGYSEEKIIETCMKVGWKKELVETIIKENERK